MLHKTISVSGTIINSQIVLDSENENFEQIEESGTNLRPKVSETFKPEFSRYTNRIHDPPLPATFQNM